MELLWLWLLMAVICAMIAGAKKGPLTGLVFFIFGFLLWPIALVAALLMRDRRGRESASSRG